MTSPAVVFAQMPPTSCLCVREQQAQKHRRLADSVVARVGRHNEFIRDRRVKKKHRSHVVYPNIWSPSQEFKDFAHGMFVLTTMDPSREYAVGKRKQPKVNIWNLFALDKKPNKPATKPQPNNTLPEMAKQQHPIPVNHQPKKQNLLPLKHQPKKQDVPFVNLQPTNQHPMPVHLQPKKQDPSPAQMNQQQIVKPQVASRHESSVASQEAVRDLLVAAKAMAPAPAVRAPVQIIDWTNYKQIMQDILNKQNQVQHQLHQLYANQNQNQNHRREAQQHRLSYESPLRPASGTTNKARRHSLDAGRRVQIIAPVALKAPAPSPPPAPTPALSSRKLSNGRQVLSVWLLKTQLVHTPINWKVKLLLALHEPLRHGLVFLQQQGYWMRQIATAFLESQDQVAVPTEQHLENLFQWLERFEGFARTQAERKKQDVFAHVVFKNSWRNTIEQHYAHVFGLFQLLNHPRSKALLRKTVSFCDFRASHAPRAIVRQLASQLNELVKIIQLLTSTLQEILEWEEKKIMFALQSIRAEDVGEHFVAPLLANMKMKDLQWVLETSLRWGGLVEFNALCGQLSFLRRRVYRKWWRGHQVIPRESGLRLR